MKLDGTALPSAQDGLMKVGVPGLDDVLGGGLTSNRLYLVEGTPGAGKTTIALQFLIEGAKRGESVLYVTLSETAQELKGVARSHGWDLSGIEVREMLPSEAALEPDEQYTMFHPSEVELSETTLRILSDVDVLKPSRVVFDSLSELRLLAGSSLRYRRQILALKQFFAGRQCTVLLLDDMTAMKHDLQVQSIAHAVIRLEQISSDYGAARRRLVVSKYRGQQFRGGYHDYRIERGGLRVFPRLVASEHPSAPAATQARIPSGLEALDALLGGGLERGTSTLFVGAPGTGKSTVAVQFALAAARRGECAALFIFDESIHTLRTRCESMGMDLGPFIESGRIKVRQVDPAELSPGEFVHLIRLAVAECGAAVVVIDSLNGYLNAMPDERFLIVQLHELLSYLGQAGVATLLVGAQHGLIGMQMKTPVDASYLADAVVLLRYFELEGEVRQAISVLKKRGGAHERSIRDFSMTATGLKVGEPLRHFRGILTGIPVPTDGVQRAS
ncbi:circadian clock protein KaiC [Variovorax beijingensis]|uniref:non-specific serine/threonine protein kinase n=2 Tax=Variovorax TaxID=34072 RepID=A0AAE3XSD0_VARPD|nr:MULTISPECIES: ATPase domain-containing protein [Variovorax]MBD9666367.1 AAA family ATPase [Variovorax sp. VRV01]MDP9962624.1 circadian clock protein KaiC [Variovorax paradoxus]MDR6424873.1 circadian clock protein KaiC [Variovorax paradoxus]MDR6451853.1 circadian clock protein KaiC [Variovorax paradoxus]TWD89087.1 circadian clock protein KaiC [Variovorax beijingensis]